MYYVRFYSWQIWKISIACPRVWKLYRDITGVSYLYSWYGLRKFVKADKAFVGFDQQPKEIVDFFDVVELVTNVAICISGWQSWLMNQASYGPYDMAELGLKASEIARGNLPDTRVALRFSRPIF